MTSIFKLLSLITLLLVVGYLAHRYMLFDLLSPDFVRGYVSSLAVPQSWILFGTIYALATVLFLPGAPFTILAGVLFGPLVGTIVVVISAGVGACVAFFLARVFGQGVVSTLLSKYAHTLYEYDRKLEERGLATVLFLRLVPLFPFNTLNVTLGLTKVRSRDYIIGTFIGIIPGTFAYVYFGDVIAMPTLLGVVLFLTFFIVLFILSFVLQRFMAMGSYDYDIIIIGAGAGGLNIAGFMRRVGFRTLIIERDEHNIGGDCLNSGCVPSKALIHIANQVHSIVGAKQFGLETGGRISFEEVRNHIELTKNVFKKNENPARLRELGHDVIIGSAKFAGPRSVEVNGKIISARKIIIATGGTARKLNIPGADLPHVISNVEVFSLKKLPESLTVIGAGPIGLELGQAFSRLGSRVCIVNDAGALLPHHEKPAGEILQSAMEEDGVTFYMNSKVKEIQSDSVVIESNNEEVKIPSEKVLVAIGRRVSVEGLALEKAGITYHEGKIAHDDYMRTSNKHVYVVGDVAGEGQFTHLTELHASVVLRTFFAPKLFWKRLSLDAFANVMYTSPALAGFGLTETELKKRGIRYTKEGIHLSEDDRSIIDNTTHGYISIYIGSDGEIHGGTIVSDYAGEIVRELILACAKGLTVKDLLETTYPYPIHARAILSVCRAYESRRLTKTAKGVLQTLFH